MNHPLIEVSNLHVTFSHSKTPMRAVRGVSFSLYPNETLALVGESGSGKSVMAKSIPGLLPKTALSIEGNILFGGVNLRGLKEKQLRTYRGKKIGFIFQDPMSSLNPTMKVGEQIEEACRHFPRKERREMTLKLLHSVGIPQPHLRINQYPHELSGGMRQRVMIAMALGPNPDVLIMDEPTTALDVTIQAQILKLIQKIKSEREMAILFITHDLSLVAGFCDRLMVMYAGKIVEVGATEQVLKSPSHPYTQALIKSIPRLDKKRRLAPIQGAPPDLRKVLNGCPFAKRCPKAKGICHAKEPLLNTLKKGHKTSCFIYEQTR